MKQNFSVLPVPLSYQNELAKAKAETEFEKYRVIQDRLFISDFDKYMIESVEVGAYNTCLNGCKYCYANFNDKAVKTNIKLYDAASPLLCGDITPEDKITIRKIKSLKDNQLSFLHDI